MPSPGAGAGVRPLAGVSEKCAACRGKRYRPRTGWSAVSKILLWRTWGSCRTCSTLSTGAQGTPCSLHDAAREAASMALKASSTASPSAAASRSRPGRVLQSSLSSHSLWPSALQRLRNSASETAATPRAAWRFELVASLPKALRDAAPVLPRGGRSQTLSWKRSGKLKKTVLPNLSTSTCCTTPRSCMRQAAPIEIAANIAATLSASWVLTSEGSPFRSGQAAAPPASACTRQSCPGSQKRGPLELNPAT
mmetsp:Transcript_98459/g.294016  ORF Transcript_98459/g.294016 Transcript_98459/m.294016 type:complete len:251 (-) Transcript_98459:323-1075(-)